jgi:hypothetical protein
MNGLQDLIAKLQKIEEAVLRSSDGKPVTDGSGKVVSTGSTTPAELAQAQAEITAPVTAQVPAAMEPVAPQADNGLGQNAPGVSSNVAVAQGSANPEIQNKIDKLKTILGLNVTAKESIVFKSKIGRLIAEEFGILEAPDDAAQAMARSASNTVAPGAREEADALWAEISKAMETPGALTPGQRKDVENMTQAFQQFQQNNPLPQAQTVQPGDKPITPTTPGQDKPKSKNGYKNAGTTAYQNWLNTNGVKVAVDGMWGPETQGAYLKLQQLKPKEFGSGGSRWQEMSDMMGVGTAHNVKPTPGKEKDYVWLNSPRYMESMKKYGYDPKTGNPISGNPNTGSSQKVAPVATATPKTIADYDTAMKTATDKLTQLYKVDPNSAETKAANAELLKLAQGKSALMNAPVASARPTGGAAAYTETPEYKKLLANLQTTFKSGAESPAYKQAMADLQTYIKAQTPVAESVGFANDELNRIVSLVHHR